MTESGDLSAADRAAAQELALAVRRGDRRALAKAITGLEDARATRQAQSDLLLDLLLPPADARPLSLRLAISGPPGVGKSTFIETFGQRLLTQGRRLAILAIDPTSPLSGGSILGDRVRMETLSGDPRVFIRPSPAGASLGGVARRTRANILACEAAGYDTVIVETVGVGQSETQAASMTDVFLVLHQPHSGDEIQGMKRGLLELADLVVVTKADGATLAAAERAKAELAQTLHIARSLGGLEPPTVLTVSSTEGRGFDEIEAALTRLVAERQASGRDRELRRQQATAWFRQEIVDQFLACLHADRGLGSALADMEGQVRAGTLSPVSAARQLLSLAGKDASGFTGRG